MNDSERVIKAIRTLHDKQEIAAVIETMEYDSDWNAETLMSHMANAFEAEISARAEACN